MRIVRPATRAESAVRSLVSSHGFVLAGGESRRMGSDKAFVVWQGRTLLDRSIEALEPCDRVSVIHRRPDHVRSMGVECIQDVDGGQGPLDGIRTALKHTVAEVVVVLAVDLVAVERRHIEMLLESFADGDVVCGLRSPDGTRQVLAAAWATERARRIVDDAWAAGERSVHRLVERNSVRWIEVDRDVLRNVNTPEDLAPGVG